MSGRRRGRVRKRVNSRRIAGAVGLLSVSVGMAAKSAQGVFTASRTATHGTTTGALALALSDVTGATTFDATISAAYPGWSAVRLIDVTVGATGYKTLSLVRTVVGSSSALDSDANGLALAVDRCSVAWTGTGDGPFTCSGSITSWISESPTIIGTKNLTTGSDLTANAVNHYRMAFTLPATTAPDSTRNKASTVRFTFTGTQRDGIAK